MGRGLLRQLYGTLKANNVSGPWVKCDFDIDVAGGLRIKSKFPEENACCFVNRQVLTN
jgi:hypothetical protein